METGLFKSQKVNGILGLFANTDTTRNSPNFLDELYDVHQDHSKSFSLCLGTDGGFMTLGGYNVNKHMPNEDIQTVPYLRGSNYIVEIYGIDVVGGPDNKWRKETMDSRFESDNKFEAMLDSGTTFTYLKSDVFNDMAETFSTYCSIANNCGGGDNRTFNDDFCKTYEPSIHGSLKEFFNSFPKMYFKLKGGATYVWFASDYLYDSGMYSSGSSREFCTGVRANDQPGPSILGGQFMRHYDVYFNREKNSISYIRSNCDEIKTVPGIKNLLQLLRRLVLDVVNSASLNVNSFHMTLLMIGLACLLALWVWKQILQRNFNKKNELTQSKKSCELEKKTEGENIEKETEQVEKDDKVSKTDTETDDTEITVNEELEVEIGIESEKKTNNNAENLVENVVKAD